MEVMTCLPIYFRPFLGIINLIYNWIRSPPCRCMLCITVSLGSFLFWAATFSWDSTGSRQKNFTNVFKLGCLKMDMLDHFGIIRHLNQRSPFIKMQRESCNSPIVQWKIILIPTFVHRFRVCFGVKVLVGTWILKMSKLHIDVISGWRFQRFNPPEK